MTLPQSKSYYNSTLTGSKNHPEVLAAATPRCYYSQKDGSGEERQSHRKTRDPKPCWRKYFRAGALSPAPPRWHQVKSSSSPPALGPALPCSRHTHLLTVIFSEFIQKPRSLLPSQVPQEGSEDRTDMLWVGKEKREHAVIRAVIITSLQA